MRFHGVIASPALRRCDPQIDRAYFPFSSLPAAPEHGEKLNDEGGLGMMRTCQCEVPVATSPSHDPRPLYNFTSEDDHPMHRTWRTRAKDHVPRPLVDCARHPTSLRRPAVTRRPQCQLCRPAGATWASCGYWCCGGRAGLLYGGLVNYVVDCAVADVYILIIK
ncbi:hypothetical protein BV25DRAFT_140591 [Artomyces pyxidatus]|uniref:Uncharacterized protein n=1 Tax=Artomyces pyxidatus TaxID=48021 RepID=A0ACB8T8E2_9AGAM|nr:hypothetical protein BV25DRAFT_140591 [Artomyces pyxidatus]